MGSIDSRSAMRVQDEPKYVTSWPGDDRWAQPSVFCYSIRVLDGAIYGTLIAPARRILESPAFPALDPELSAELRAWEAASDEIDESLPA